MFENKINIYLNWFIQSFLIVPMITLSLTACGGASKKESVPDYSLMSEEKKPSSEGMEVSGILGTIPTYMIQERMQFELSNFEQCFHDRTTTVEFLAGHIEMYFRVRLDGDVRWVYPRQSTIGDRATELCLLKIAEQVRFTKPRGGGEAEFAWGFEMQPIEDIRPPVDWEENRLIDIVTNNAASIRNCNIGKASYSVTAYVAPGGKVIEAGIATSDQSDTSAFDCIVNAVQSWKMPDPGSYPAKVSFIVP